MTLAQEESEPIILQELSSQAAADSSATQQQSITLIPVECKPQTFFLEKYLRSFSASVVFFGLVLLSICVVVIEKYRYALPFNSFDSDSFQGPGSSDSCCNSLVLDGHWKDTVISKYEKWQPELCALTSYDSAMLKQCAETRRIVVIGDSIARELYNGIGSIGNFKSNSSAGHHDFEWKVNDRELVSFHWDPFLNNTDLKVYASENTNGITFIAVAGFWFMKHYSLIAGEEAFLNAFDKLFAQFLDLNDGSVLYVVPLNNVNESLLSEDRKMLRNSLVTRYNMEFKTLYETSIDQHSDKFNVFWSSAVEKILSSTIATAPDGLHDTLPSFSIASNVLLNHACNRYIFKSVNPSKASCCSSYQPVSWKQICLVILLFFYGPICWIVNSRIPQKFVKYFPSKEHSKSISIIFLALIVCFMADRTNVFAKYEKQFDPIAFGILLLLSVLFGFYTLETAKDDGFLNRHITDEWKGWMQILILIYHYTGASYISPIYNLMRILVASYLFMTGYGHFTYFYKKNDFGIIRIAKTLVRLNLLTVGLVYMMNASYQSYYFSPLVTVWFLIIWIVMKCGNAYNKNTFFILSKIGGTCVCCAVFAYNYGIFEFIMNAISVLLGANIDIKDWHFRFSLDMYIVMFGCLIALGVIKGADRWNKLEESKQKWLNFFATFTAFFALIGYVVYESVLNKYSYNHFHPYLAFIPVSAFVVLRNASWNMRRTSSAFFKFFGKISLETFILQFHIWLALDTRGLLVAFPGVPAANFIITSFIFLYLSYHCAKATSDLTDMIVVSKRSDITSWRLAIFVLISVLINHLTPA